MIINIIPTHDNDPSAGSPTETLLRLHLPLNVKVYSSLCLFQLLFQTIYFIKINTPKTSPQNSSVDATGGVYKGQGCIQCKMLTCVY